MVSRNDAKAAVAENSAGEQVESQVEAPPSDAKSTPKREPKVKAEPKDCACRVPNQDKTGAEASGDAVKFAGCNGGKSTRKFAPGHDAKLVGYLTRSYEAGRISAQDAIDTVKKRSDNSALLVGKIKAAVKRVDEQRVARERRDQAAKDAKAAESTTPEAAVDAKAAEVASV